MMAYREHCCLSMSRHPWPLAAAYTSRRSRRPTGATSPASWRRGAGASLALLLAVTLLSQRPAPVRAITHNITWSAEWTSQYRESPLIVNSGDFLNILCQEGSYETVVYLPELSQYENCTRGDGFVNTNECGGDDKTYLLTIKATAADIDGVASFAVNEYHYLASFGDGMNLFVEDSASSCTTDDFKMMLYVLEGFCESNFTIEVETSSAKLRLSIPPDCTANYQVSVAYGNCSYFPEATTPMDFDSSGVLEFSPDAVEEDLGEDMMGVAFCYEVTLFYGIAGSTPQQIGETHNGSVDFESVCISDERCVVCEHIFCSRCLEGYKMGDTGLCSECAVGYELDKEANNCTLTDEKPTTELPCDIPHCNACKPDNRPVCVECETPGYTLASGEMGGGHQCVCDDGYKRVEVTNSKEKVEGNYVCEFESGVTAPLSPSSGARHRASLLLSLALCVAVSIGGALLVI